MESELVQTIALDHGWSFGGERDPGAPLPTRLEGVWPTVDLPHCAVALSWHDWDPSSWEHEWLYARRVHLPAAVADARVLLDFDGVLSATTPTVNGTTLPRSKGGYLPFSYELTGLVQEGENDLVVIVDGTWQQIPPSGAAGGAASVDYLQPAGISRHVAVRIVPSPAYVSDVFVSPAAPAAGSFDIGVAVTIDTNAPLTAASVEVQLRPHGLEQVLAQARASVPAARVGEQTVSVTLAGVEGIVRWSPSSPALYDLTVTLRYGDTAAHALTVRTGFRDAQFTPEGFFLNGERLILFGINRHQLFPYMGMSAPDRLHRRDAEILKSELNVNAVRCSHYPQSPAFLDACDELGIIVWEETPGWWYIGDWAWQDLWYQDVATMVQRDRSRPSIVIWGVQPNETQPSAAQATRAKKIADSKDGTRPTAGACPSYDWREYVHPVYAYDDYTTAIVDNATVPALRPPVPAVPYLVTESVGAVQAVHYFVRNSRQEDLQIHSRDHGMAHSQARDPAGTYCGLFGWAGVDYASLNGYTVGAVKTPGVLDTFRVPKPGAAIYQAQIDPSARPVIQPAFSWYFGPDAPVTTLGDRALVWSNCHQIHAYLDGLPIGALTPAGSDFANLAYPPFYLDTTRVGEGTTPDLRLDGYLDGRLIHSRSFSADTSQDALLVTADDTAIVGDGSDATRIVFAAVDRFGNLRAYADGVVTLTHAGPGRLVGESSFDYAQAGGVGGVWLRSVNGQNGRATITASHPALGNGTVAVDIVPAPDDLSP